MLSTIKSSFTFAATLFATLGLMGCPPNDSGSTDTSKVTNSESGNTSEPTTTPTTGVEAICGNGILEDGLEECDDGNKNNNDACTNECKDAYCGDGYLWTENLPSEQQAEGCDDGNDEWNDSCTNECKNNVCGDGYTYEGVEECDYGTDSNVGAYKGCNADCTKSSQYCGNGVIESEYEECDPAVPLETTECTDITEISYDGGTLICDDFDCQINKGNCYFCGDGEVDPGEECDPGSVCKDGTPCKDFGDCWPNNGNCVPANKANCSPMCKKPQCGNGIKEGTEQCDDGNMSNSDACTNECKNNVCRDGYVWEGVEQCDDGNELNTDACKYDCFKAQCGDGYVWEGVEQCDNFFPNNGPCPETCSESCQKNTCNL